MAPKVESISSEDGAYCIQLGEAIQVQTKHAGTKVGVYNGRLLKSPQPVDIEAEAAKKLGHLGSYLCQDTNEDWKVKNRENGGHTGPYDIVIKVFSELIDGKSFAEAEAEALEHLTTKNCQHTPTYFGDFKVGLEHYVLMSKLPGASLDDDDAWQWDRKNVVAAFDRAIEAVLSCGIANGSPNGRNVLWDKVQGKCYIVDFERAEYAEPRALGRPRKKWRKRQIESFDQWIE